MEYSVDTCERIIKGHYNIMRNGLISAVRYLLDTINRLVDRCLRETYFKNTYIAYKKIKSEGVYV